MGQAGQSRGAAPQTAALTPPLVAGLGDPRRDGDSWPGSQTNAPILPTGSEERAIWGKCQRQSRASVASFDRVHLACPHIPELDGPISTRRRDQPTIGGKGDRVDRPGLPGEHTTLLAGGHIR